VAEGEAMTQAEREREEFDRFRDNRDIDYWQEGIFYSLWQINQSLEKLIRVMDKKEKK
jgi:hypothetical protein